MENTQNRSITSNINDVFVANAYLITDNTKIRNLNLTLEAAINCVKKSLESIETMLNSNCDEANIESEIKNELYKCSSILESTLSLSKHLTTFSYIELIDIEVFLNSVGQMLFHVFKHCKNSETLYTSFIEQIGSNITDVFKKCHELQVLYFNILTNHVQFDLSVDEQLSTLEEVLDLIVDIGEVVINLDVKTMAEEWKGYSKLCEQYADWIKDRYVHEKATEILCDELMKQLTFSLSEKSSDAKDISRSLKISNFILKILVKLGEVFQGCLLKDYTHVVKCMTFINQYSSSYMSFIKINPTIAEGIQSHINIGAELFLSNLLTDSGFKYCVIENIPELIQDDSLQFGCVQILVNIMKLLLQKRDDVRDLWIDDIVCVLFDIIQLCHTELLKKIEFECSSIGTICFYDYILLRLSSLIISSNRLNKIEEKLLESVMDVHIWKSLLAYDVWMIIAKNALVEFRYNQLTYLISLFENVDHWQMIKDTPPHIFISSIYCNLFISLSNDYKVKIYKTYPILKYSHIWKAMGLCYLPKEELLNDNVKLLKISLTLNDCKNVHTNNFKETSSRFQLLGTTSIEPSEDVNKVAFKITEAWNFISQYIDGKKVSPDLSSSCIKSCMISLCDITQNIAPYISNNLWTKILINIMTVIKKIHQTAVKILILQLLKYFVYKEIENDDYKNKLSNQIADTFKVIVNDDCDMIRLMTIKTFIYFAQNCVSEDLVICIASKDNQFRDVRNLIVKRKAYDSLNEMIEKYYCIENQFKHDCVNSSVVDVVDDFSEILEDLNDNSDEITNCIKIMNVECDNLKSFVVNNSLSEVQKRELLNIESNLYKILHK